MLDVGEGKARKGEGLVEGEEGEEGLGEARKGKDRKMT